MKKVITIVSLSLVGVLILTTIILACITVTGTIDFGTPSQLVVYWDELGEFNKDSSAKKLINEIEEGTKQKYLTGLFEGTLDNITVETRSEDEHKAYIARENDQDNRVLFELKYDEEQTIKVEDETVTFHSLVVEITDENRDKLVVYAIPNFVANGTTSVGYYTKITINGDFDDVYMMVKGFVEEYI